MNKFRFDLDPRRFLEIPSVYTFFQAIIGAHSARRKIIQNKIPLFDGARVLEVGCGPGTNLDYLSRTIDYTGCDISEKYIRYAQNKYDGRGHFVKAGVGELTTKNLGSFDFILSIGLLHHLTDSEGQILGSEALELLNQRGCFIAIEPCYSEERSRLEQWIDSNDRGKYIRSSKDYVQILSSSFSKIETQRFKEGNLIPHSGLLIKAQQ